MCEGGLNVGEERNQRELEETIKDKYRRLDGEFHMHYPSFEHGVYFGLELARKDDA